MRSKRRKVPSHVTIRKEKKTQITNNDYYLGLSFTSNTSTGTIFMNFY